MVVDGFVSVSCTYMYIIILYVLSNVNQLILQRADVFRLLFSSGKHSRIPGTKYQLTIIECDSDPVNTEVGQYMALLEFE